MRYLPPALVLLLAPAYALAEQPVSSETKQAAKISCKTNAAPNAKPREISYTYVTQPATLTTPVQCALAYFVKCTESGEWWPVTGKILHPGACSEDFADLDGKTIVEKF